MIAVIVRSDMTQPDLCTVRLRLNSEKSFERWKPQVLLTKKNRLIKPDQREVH
jgi:hypothetical protein